MGALRRARAHQEQVGSRKKPEVPPQSSFKFFDPNSGLFDWPADDAPQQIAAELSSWLNEKYQITSVRLSDGCLPIAF